MRQKSRTQHEAIKLQQVDYTEKLFQAVLTKKKFIGKGPRYFYILKNLICIAKSPEAVIPERQFPLNYDLRIQWAYSQNQLKSLTLIAKGENFEYFGSHDQLLHIKKIIGLRLFQLKIQDEYKADSVLGRGSYATVLELTNLFDKKSYAAKCIDQNRINEKKNGFKQLLQEINAMRTLSDPGHENILKLHELYIGNQNYYLVMELAKGGSLLSMMKKRDKLFDKCDIKLIMRQILEGLSYIHSFKIMHRDLKPENILFMTKNLNSLKLADFGLAQCTTMHPYTYPKCGTPGFVAPEILLADSENAQYTELCDIFSAGVVFFILLTGEPLFDKKDKAELLDLNKKCEFNLQKFSYDMISAEERQILGSMLAKNPEQRWTAWEILTHKYFSQEYVIESEIDYQRANNIAMYKEYLNTSFKRSRMPDFTKNPFIQFGVIRDKSLTTNRPKNITLVMQTNLRLDKSSSQEQFEIPHNFLGSFNFQKDEIIQ